MDNNLHSFTSFKIVDKWALRFLKVFVTLCLIAPAGVFGQILKVDSVRLSLSGEVPFDKSFVVQIPDPQSSIVMIDVYKLYVRKGKVSFFPTKPLQPNQAKDQPKFLYTANFDRQGKNINVFMDPLSPNTNFELRMRRKFRGKALLELRKIAYEIHLGNDQSAELDALLRGLEPVLYGFNKSAFGAGTCPWFENYRTKFETYVQDKISPVFSGLTTNLNNYTTQNLTLGNWQKMTSLAVGLKVNIAGMNRFWRLNENRRLTAVQQGWVTMSKPLAKEQKAFTNFEEKAANIRKSITELDSLIDLIYYVKLNDRANQTMIESVISDLANLRVQMTNNMDYLTKATQDFKNLIDEEDNIQYVNSLTANNEVFNLKTKGSRHIIPEIGLASVFANGNSTSDLITRPFFAVSIYLRQTDKNIPMRHLRNSWLHRFSFSIGVTVIPIDNEEFKDLYNQVSLLTGANFKLTRALGINAGWVWLKQRDVNPIIDQFNVAPRPYIGLALDVDVAEGLGKITSRFGLK